VGTGADRPLTLARLAAITAAVLACWLAPAATAQQPAQLPRPAFSSSVDIVSVDVNVIDRYGRPVRDLEAGDFSLSVDGRPRKIASAQFISVTAPPVAPEPKPAEYSTNVGAANGRLIVIVVDRGSIAPVRSKDVLAAAARFVSRLSPSDRVALFSIPSGPAVDFTTDHDSVVSALQRTDGQANPGPGSKNIGIAEALGFERRSPITMDEVVARECGSTPGRGGGGSEHLLCRKLVVEEASIVAAYAHERARNTLAGLRNILERLGSGDTPKTIVLISEGLVVDGDRFAAAGLARAMAAAHATIYALKPEPSDSDASQARAPQGRARDRAVYEEGLLTVTRAGGGEMFRVIADPDFAFDRLSSELSGYYLLGFEPEPSDRDGKEHTIQVKVQRDDVAVRSRLQFTVGGTAGKTHQQVISDLLRTPIPATELPLRLTTYAFQDPDSSKVRLLVAMEVDRSVDPSGEMALGLVLVKPGGDVGATFFQPSIGAPDRPDPRGQRAFATLLVDPGQYILKAAVVDTEGRRGSLERPVRAFMTRMARFRATELLIGDSAGGESGAGGVVPTVTGELSGEQLHAYMELFSDAPAGFAATAATIEVLPAGGALVVERAEASLQSLQDDQPVRAVSASVPIAMLSPGSYVARAVVTVDGRKVGQMARPFRIVKK
jgi:VWFA-related protein